MEIRQTKQRKTLKLTDLSCSDLLISGLTYIVFICKESVLG